MLIYAVVVTALMLVLMGLLWLEGRSYDVLEEQAGILEDENESIRTELKARDVELKATYADLEVEREVNEELIAVFALATAQAGFTAEESEDGGMRLVPYAPKAKKRGRK